jgi:hypothetical protein
MENQFFKDLPKFTTPEEEISYLREHISSREKQLSEERKNIPLEQVAKDAIDAYKFVPAEKVVPDNLISRQDAEQIVLSLTPETHDKQIEEFFGLMLDRGLKNTFSVLKKMNNPHLDDDFHRFLVQYLITGQKPADLKEGLEENKGLSMRLFEVSLPNFDKEKKTPASLISGMEQFLSGMQAVGDGRTIEGKEYFTLELAVENHGSNMSLYVAVPASRADLFEKNMLAVYPEAKIKEVPNDYNIFNEQGFAMTSVAKLSELPVFPLRSFENGETDPMSSIISAFSKFNQVGEGASVQFVIKPVGDAFIKRYNRILDQVRNGGNIKEIYSGIDSWSGALKNAAKDFFSAPTNKDESVDDKKDDEKLRSNIEKMNKKLGSTILSANIRIVASAPTKERTEQMIREISSAFNQFTDTTSNSLVFQNISESRLFEELHSFSYRIFKEENNLPLTQKEIASMVHMPENTIASPHIAQIDMTLSPAPAEVSNRGVLLGMNSYRGQETEVRFSPEDRLRHLYVIGQTGTGKTTILKNMIVQDIQNGEGVCFIDPHGNDIEDILANIPPERADDVIYFDPGFIDRPIGLNMLEYDVRFPEQKTFVVDELLSIFRKLFGGTPESMGPAFEQYFRNSALLAMDDPSEGATLLEIGRVLANKEYRQRLIAKCVNPIIRQFWESAEKTTGEASLANYVNYITNKFDVFITNEIMRPIVVQQKSSLNFREIIDGKKILLVNLSKGRLGEINSNLLGLVIVGKLFMAALSRVDSIGKDLPPFYLYIDEFQNVTTNSISQILSEARKYKLGLNLAHQYIAQIDEGIKNAVFGNVGSMAAFRIGVDDADFLAKQFEPTFTGLDLQKLENRNAYVKMLVNGFPAKPFNIRTLAPNPGNRELAQKIKELSHLKYGKDRKIVEAEILSRYSA